MALLMSLVLGTGFAITGNSVFAQSYNDQSYDDSRYDSSDSYSKYPSKDNKYVCQRGPFEGFYVSSVEFCKPDFDDKKFDDKKDRHDDDGKKNGINLNTYVITDTVASTGTSVEATARCDLGDEISGGGFEYTPSTARVTVSSNEPFEDTPTDPTLGNQGWEAQLDNIPSGGVTLFAYAVCLDNPPPHQP
jgi:hypothetical protein